MNQKDAFNGSAPYTSCDSDQVFENKLNYNSDFPSEYQGIQSNFPVHQKSRNHYDSTDKTEDEVKPSSTHLFGKYYSPYSIKDDITSSNHFQDLNEKFRELEFKMIEVEKCFKEANRYDIDGVEKRFNSNDFRSTSEGCGDPGNKTMTNRYRYKEQTSDGKVTKGWTRDKSSSDQRKYHNRMTTDGSGDVLQNSSETISQNSDKTMIRPLEKSSVHLLNGHSVKIAMNQIHQHEPSPKLIYDRDMKSTDVDLLEKSKKLILSLIDKELKKMEVKEDPLVTSNINQVTKMADNNRSLKKECIYNIERELKTLRKLELLEQ